MLSLLHIINARKVTSYESTHRCKEKEETRVQRAQNEVTAVVSLQRGTVSAPDMERLTRGAHRKRRYGAELPYMDNTIFRNRLDLQIGAV